MSSQDTASTQRGGCGTAYCGVSQTCQPGLAGVSEHSEIVIVQKGPLRELWRQVRLRGDQASMCIADANIETGIHDERCAGIS